MHKNNVCLASLEPSEAEPVSEFVFVTVQSESPTVLDDGDRPWTTELVGTSETGD